MAGGMIPSAAASAAEQAEQLVGFIQKPEVSVPWFSTVYYFQEPKAA